MQQHHTAPDDDRLMSLVHSALAQPLDEREAYLRRECAGDSQLFEQALDYVQWEERMGGFRSARWNCLIPLSRPENCSRP